MFFNLQQGHHYHQGNQGSCLGWFLRLNKINYKKWPKQLGRFEEKNLYFSTKQKTPQIYCVFFAELKKSTLFYQAKNLLNYTWSSLQNWRDRYFYYSTKHLNTLGLLCRFEEIIFFFISPSKKHTNFFKNILGLLCRIEEMNIFIILLGIEQLFKYLRSSLQIWRNKYFFYFTKQKNY